jgi:hypothetical protein
MLWWLGRKATNMRLVVTCNAAEPSADCKKTRVFNVSREQAKEIQALVVERKGLCSVCFAAGKEPKVKAQKRSRVYDENELVTVVCSNYQCRYGEEITPRATYMVDGKEVVREEKVRAVKARITVTRAEATQGPLCEGCMADQLALEKKEAAKAKRAAKKAGS